MKSFAQTFELFGPFAIKALAVVAAMVVFAPLLAAFAAPFIG
jgi:hypothetical protein